MNNGFIYMNEPTIKIEETNIYELLGRKEAMIASLLAEIFRLKQCLEMHRAQKPTEK